MRKYAHELSFRSTYVVAARLSFVCFSSLRVDSSCALQCLQLALVRVPIDVAPLQFLRSLIYFSDTYSNIVRITYFVRVLVRGVVFEKNDSRTSFALLRNAHFDVISRFPCKYLSHRYTARAHEKYEYGTSCILSVSLVDCFFKSSTVRGSSTWIFCSSSSSV